MSALHELRKINLWFAMIVVQTAKLCRGTTQCKAMMMIQCCKVALKNATAVVANFGVRLTFHIANRICVNNSILGKM